MRIKLFLECVKLINIWRSAIDQTDKTIDLIIAVIAPYLEEMDAGHDL